jgi:hypothetical protein
MCRRQSSRTIDCVQKNDAQRLPRVTGVTLCMLVAG